MEKKDDGRKFVELEWVCPNCEGVNRGSKKTCESCGAPQPENVKFRRAASEKVVTDAKLVAAAKAGADIHCGFCGTRNPGNAATCSQCGADLKEGKARAAGQVLQASTAPKMLVCANCGADNAGSERLCAQCGSPLKQAEAPLSAVGNAQSVAKANIAPKKVNWWWLGGIIGALLLCCIVGFILLTRPAKSLQGVVSSTEWKTVVPVEEIRAVEYNDKSGSPPAGAYNVSCRTEDEEVCSTSLVDQGNGFAEEVTNCHTESTEYCDYTLDEWKTIQTYALSGNDLFPIYEEPALHGEQRIGTASEELTVYFDTKDGEEIYHPDTVSEFQQYDAGSTWTLRMNALGGILSVER